LCVGADRSTDAARTIRQFGSSEAVWDSIAPNVVIIDRNLDLLRATIDDQRLSRFARLQTGRAVSGDKYPVYVYAKGTSP